MPASWKTVTQLFKRNSKVMDGSIQYAETKDHILHVNCKYRGINQVITSGRAVFNVCDFQASTFSL